MEKTRRILVVDDEADLCDILKFNLEVAGYEVETAQSAEDALLLPLSRFDLILLDVMMGEVDGFSMARMLKRHPSTADIPIIFLTAKDSTDDTIEGLEIGADDYITKPFSIKEVLLRVAAVLRRSGPSSGGDTLRYGDMVLDLDAKTLRIGGGDVALTRTEFDLLQLFLENPGRVFSRQELIAKVWPEGVIVLDRSVDVNITRLRKKLGAYAPHIVTRSGFGYLFEE